jgi:hypothetical protein
MLQFLLRGALSNRLQRSVFIPYWLSTAWSLFTTSSLSRYIAYHSDHIGLLLLSLLYADFLTTVALSSNQYLHCTTTDDALQASQGVRPAPISGIVQGVTTRPLQTCWLIC